MKINYYTYLELPEDASVDAIKKARSKLLAEFHPDTLNKFNINDLDLKAKCKSITDLLSQLYYDLLTEAVLKSLYDSTLANTRAEGIEFDTLLEARAEIKVRKEEQDPHFHDKKRLDELTKKEKAQDEKIQALENELKKIKKLSTQKDQRITDLEKENETLRSNLAKARDSVSILTREREQFNLFQPAQETEQKKSLSLQLGPKLSGPDIPRIQGIYKVITTPMLPTAFGKRFNAGFIEVYFFFEDNEQRDAFHQKYKAMCQKAWSENPNARLISCEFKFRNISDRILALYSTPEAFKFWTLLQEFNKEPELYKHNLGNYLMPLLREAFELEHIINMDTCFYFKKQTAKEITPPDKATQTEATIEEVIDLIHHYDREAQNPAIKSKISMLMEHYVVSKNTDELTTSFNDTPSPSH